MIRVLKINEMKMKWTLITGGAKRLGANICRTLASKGYPILIHYNNSSKEAASVVADCRQLGVEAECIAGNFSSLASTELFANELLQRFPDIANLINNVGNYKIESALETSLSDWYDLFQTNLHAAFTLIKAFSPSIKKNQGNIINIGVAGIQHIRADTHCTAYSLTKTGLLMLTKSLALELAPFKVRVNMVSPGQLVDSIDPLESIKIPLKRNGSPSEVAEAIAFLLDASNGYITGQNLEVAGGLRL
jgi:NAD(P)-dependent dehydrogenase (short-subunit alcohol dehydrogenase family)